MRTLRPPDGPPRECHTIPYVASGDGWITQGDKGNPEERC
jgi:hypothetical protein